MASLGCGALELIFTNRGSATPIADPIPFQSLTWGRVVDDISTCEADLALSCKLPSNLRPLRHEAAVYRDGQRVWVGPLLEIDSTEGSTKIIAKDKLWWSTVRMLRASHVSTGAPVDAGTLFGDLLADAYSADNTSRFSWNVATCGISVERDWPYNIRQNAYEALSDLATAAVDFTVIDDVLRSDGVQITAASVPSVSNEAFTETPQITMSADTFQNHAVVMGQAAAAVQPYNEDGSVSATDNYVEVVGDAYDLAAMADFGLVERRFDRGEISDVGSANAAATSYIAHAVNGVVNFTGNLLPDFPISIDEMVPGAQFDADVLTDAGLHVIGRFRIQSFSETASGGDVTSAITAIPVGTLAVTIQ